MECLEAGEANVKHFKSSVLRTITIISRCMVD